MLRSIGKQSGESVESVLKHLPCRKPAPSVNYRDVSFPVRLYSYRVKV